MTKKLILAAIAFGFCAPSSQALDLTPHEVSSTIAGIPSLRFYFHNDGQRLSFRIDNQMTVSGGKDSAKFRFQDLNTAGMKISKSPLDPTMPFDEKNAEAYREAARGFLPKDAKAIQLEEEKPDAIPINGWTTQQYTFTYILFGVPYRCVLTFINFSATQQIVFEVSAGAEDYGKAAARSYRVLNSLGEMRAEDGVGPT